MGGLGNWGMQDFFVIFFLQRQNDVVSKESQTLFCPEEEMFEIFFTNVIWWCCPEAKWCCPEGKSIEFFFSNEERSSSERKKTQWTFLKDNIILLKDNIFIWVREKKTQTFPLKDKRESDFPKKLHHFAKGEKKWRKNFAIPMLSNPPMISRGIKSPFPIFRVGITFMRERRLIFTARSPSVFFVTWRSWFFFLFAEF